LSIGNFPQDVICALMMSGQAFLLTDVTKRRTFESPTIENTMS
jgi:hypothetical protein